MLMIKIDMNSYVVLGATLRGLYWALDKMADDEIR